MDHISILQKIMADLGQPFSQDRLVEHGQGYNNRVFSIDRYSIKLVDSNLKGVIKDVRLREYILSELADFPIPKTILFDDSKKSVPIPFLVMERLGSSNLKDSVPKGDALKRVLYDLGRLKAMLNSIKSSSYGDIAPDLSIDPSFKDWKGKISRDFDTLMDKLSARGLIDEDLLPKIKDFWRLHKALLKHESSPCLCHGDTSASNILLSDDDSLCGLIDFEYANWGGAVRDMFSSVRTNIITDNPEPMIEGYSTIQPITRDYKGLMRIYQLISNMRWLKEIPKMAWRDLSQGEAVRRKEKIRLKCTKNILRLIEG